MKLGEKTNKQNGHLNNRANLFLQFLDSIYIEFGNFSFLSCLSVLWHLISCPEKEVTVGNLASRVGVAVRARCKYYNVFSLGKIINPSVEVVIFEAVALELILRSNYRQPGLEKIGLI